jgi:hypothetical protein
MLRACIIQKRLYNSDDYSYYIGGDKEMGGEAGGDNTNDDTDGVDV